MPIPLPVELDDAVLEEFGRELDQIYDGTIASLGASDERYIRSLIRFQRSLALGSRLVIFSSLAFRPRKQQRKDGTGDRRAFLAVNALGTAGLGLAKIIENMEIGHNVMHGQWDWMRDPEISSTTWEWDNVCPSDQWKHSHNVVHHTWTNVLGMDRDIGYDVMRVTPKQNWHPGYLAQPVVNFLVMMLFEWGVGLHDVDIEKVVGGTKEQKQEQKGLLKRFRQKVRRQVAKDYVLWPALAGPAAPVVLASNVTANLIRNVWAYMIIFCGHFPAGVQVFTKGDVEGETRDRWYVRQLLGSANITGSKPFHILSGNLSHQIEHHLFPDMPSNRYPEVAHRVEALCDRYHLPYNKARLSRQFGTTTLKIWRYSLPGG